jgi:hypothetical protein
MMLLIYVQECDDDVNVPERGEGGMLFFGILTLSLLVPSQRNIVATLYLSLPAHHHGTRSMSLSSSFACHYIFLFRGRIDGWI